MPGEDVVLKVGSKLAVEETKAVLSRQFQLEVVMAGVD